MILKEQKHKQANKKLALTHFAKGLRQKKLQSNLPMWSPVLNSHLS